MKVRWEKDGGRENLEINRKERGERRENRSCSPNSPSLLSILFSLFPKGNPTATHPPLPSHLVAKQDRSIFLVMAIGTIFALFYYWVQFPARVSSPAEGRPFVQCPAGPFLQRTVLWLPPLLNRLVILLQLNFSRQLKRFVLLSFFHPHSRGNLLCVWRHKEKARLKTFAFKWFSLQWCTTYRRTNRWISMAKHNVYVPCRPASTNSGTICLLFRQTCYLGIKNKDTTSIPLLQLTPWSLFWLYCHLEEKYSFVSLIRS